MATKLSKGLIAGLVIGGLILFGIVWMISVRNSLVTNEEQVEQAWSQVENVYQRRLDLIPNLVKTVQGAAEFEKGTLESVIEARSKASSIQMDPTNLTEENLAAFEQAQSQVSSALNRLMVVVERYPELKATQNFSELQAQLEGTENRIAVERKKFTETVKAYNVKVRRFPANIVASLFGFEKKAYFKAAEGAEKAPEVDFEF
ncbi:MAG: LemA family protein [Bacteroidales bacterium]|nr:LemA family protein [Bacteroidales bacterium]